MTKVPKEMCHVIFSDCITDKLNIPTNNAKTKIICIGDNIYVKNSISAGWQLAEFKYYNRETGYVYASLVDDPYKTITSYEYMTVDKSLDVEFTIGLK